MAGTSMRLLEHLRDKIQGKLPGSARRSSEWPKVRAAHLKEHPVCAVCGGAKKLEVHHMVPFHMKPDLELNPANLITLCEAKHNGVNCHLWFGHLGNFKRMNTSVLTDSMRWNSKFQGRS
jgi:5-methylcytosine-specific restriction protein A